MLQTLFQPLLYVNWLLFTTINAPAGHTPVLDTLMPLLANDALYIFPLLVLLLWLLPGGRSAALKTERSVSHEAVIWAAAAVILALLINVTLGALIYEPRPFVSAHVHQLIAHAADASFPSDHTAVAFALASVLLLRFWLARRASVSQTKASQYDNQPLSEAARARLRWRTGILAAVGLLLAIAMGYARIYVGVHYPLDIIGGALIGICSALIILLARGLLRPVTHLAEAMARPLHLA
jgi:undecaprenyl-diphosphatase